MDPVIHRRPDFLIIGGMRCGSTTLANMLATQPSIYLPDEKELHYFDRRNPEIKTAQHYSQCFSSAADAQIIGEATPDYFTTKDCDKNIYSLLPHVKLIVILRNPVLRAWSHYRFSVASEREIEPFENALALEKERLAHPIHEHDIFFSYQQRGRYIQHIERFISKFNIDQLHIVILDELKKDSNVIARRLFDFLDIDGDDSWQQALRISNQASLINLKADHQLNESEKRTFKMNRDSADLLNSRHLKFIPRGMRDGLYRKIESRLGHADQPDVNIRQQLENYYRPYNRRLEEFIGRKLCW